MAKGAYSIVLRRVFERLGGLASLRKMKFELEFVAVDPLARSSSSRAKAAPAELPAFVEDQDSMAQEAFDFALHLVAYRALSSEHYVASFPHRWALFFSDQPEDVRLALQESEATSSAINAAEVLAHKDAAVAKILKACFFADFVTEREILIGLRQVNFSMVPKWVQHTLLGFFEGYGQSAVLENGFGKCQDQQRESNNKQMRRVKMWYTTHTSRLLPDRYRRDEVSADSRDRVGARRLTNALFEPFASEPSVSDACLKQVMGTATWPTTTALGLHRVVAAHSLLKELHEQGWQRAGYAWKGEFVLQGSLLQSGKQPEDGLWLVLSSNPFGVLTWPMMRVGPDDAKFWQPSTGSGGKARWQHVFSFDLGDWRVWPSVVRSPAHCKFRGVPGLTGVCCCTNQGSLGIVEAIVVPHT